MTDPRTNGESGPEMFVPHASGTIVPLRALDDVEEILRRIKDFPEGRPNDE